MSDVEFEQTTGWTGWIVFAATMMIIGGSFSVIFGLVAAVNDQWVAFTNTDAVLLDVSQWGWVHILLGVVLLLGGFGVLTGNVLARTIGVVAAAANLIGHFLSMPLYPLWALTVVVLDVLVIWALTVHGREMRAY
jgi:vacuolar-type H+-ATPase subunit I/STV1